MFRLTVGTWVDQALGTPDSVNGGDTEELIPPSASTLKGDEYFDWLNLVLCVLQRTGSFTIALSSVPYKALVRDLSCFAAAC